MAILGPLIVGPHFHIGTLAGPFVGCPLLIAHSYCQRAAEPYVRAAGPPPFHDLGQLSFRCPSESKYPTFEVSGSNGYTLHGFWARRPYIFLLGARAAKGSVDSAVVRYLTKLHLRLCSRETSM